MIILHGENHLASRQAMDTEIIRARKAGKAIIRLEGSSLTSTELHQALEGDLLFGENKLVIIEKIFTGRASSRQKELLAILNKTPTPVVIWEGKKIDGRKLASFKHASKKVFTYPKTIFKFLDNLTPQQPIRLLSMLRETLKYEPAELVFFLLTRRVRQLVNFRLNGRQSLDKLPPWQRSQIERQAQRFSAENLVKIYQRLIRIEISQKTGTTVLGLTTQLDLLLTTF